MLFRKRKIFLRTKIGKQISNVLLYMVITLNFESVSQTHMNLGDAQKV